MCVTNTMKKNPENNTNLIDNSPLELGAPGSSKILEVEGINAKIIHFDTGGNEKFRSTTISPYLQANIIFVCFSIDDKKSFNNCEYWYNEAVRNATDSKPLKVLVGLKSDLAKDRMIEVDEAKNYCKKLDPKLQYFECSAKTGNNINNLYQEACIEFLKRIKSQEMPNPYSESED